jgi:hypothetical protein
MRRWLPTVLATRMSPRKWPAAWWRGSSATTRREFLRCSEIVTAAQQTRNGCPKRLGESRGQMAMRNTGGSGTPEVCSEPVGPDGPDRRVCYRWYGIPEIDSVPGFAGVVVIATGEFDEHARLTAHGPRIVPRWQQHHIIRPGPASVSIGLTSRP